MTSKTRGRQWEATRERRTSFTKADGVSNAVTRPANHGQREGRCCGQVEASETPTSRIRQRLLRALPRDDSRRSARRLGSGPFERRAGTDDCLLPHMRECVRRTGSRSFWSSA
jgi:hypothetical protein